MSLSKKQRRQLKRQGLLDDNTSQKPQKTGMRLRNIKPKTENQKAIFEAFEEEQTHLLLTGFPGVGKTFIALYLAVREINNVDTPYNNVTIIRSVVPTRDIGFLPGKEKEKIEVYEQPYKTICNELYERGDAYDILKTKGQIQFTTTSFLRGCNINNSIVVIDEMANMNEHELDTIITRMGDNVRVIFCGDFKQSDLKNNKERQGFHNFISILKQLNCFANVEFDASDCVRSPLVKSYLIAREQMKNNMV